MRNTPFLAVLVVAAALLLTADPARATATYVYEGNPFAGPMGGIQDSTPPLGSYAPSDRVTASFELVSGLAPGEAVDASAVVSFWISDGRTVLTDQDVGSFDFGMQAISGGTIGSWLITADNGKAGAAFAQITTVNNFSVPVVLDRGLLGDPLLDAGVVFSTPGTWTLIPEPSSALLTGLGLAALTRWRRRATGAQRPPPRHWLKKPSCVIA